MLIFFKFCIVYFSIGRLDIKILVSSFSNFTVNAWAFWIFFACVCIHMCVDKNASACVNVCMCMWRPKVVFGSLYQLLSVVFAESRHLFLQSSPSCSVSLASPGDLSLFPECWDFCLASTPSVCVEAGPHVMDQVLYPQIHHLRNLAALWRSKLSQNFLIFHELSFVVCFLLPIKCEYFLCRYIFNVS